MLLFTLMGTSSLVVLTMVTSAYAVQCGPRDAIVAGLKRHHKEVVGGIGLGQPAMGRRDLFEIFASKSGTFTILRTRPNKYACIVGAGTDWEFATAEEVFF